MPSYEVTTPDGKKYRIDGASDKASALQAFKAQYGHGSDLATPEIPNQTTAEDFVSGLADPYVAGAQLAAHAAEYAGYPGTKTIANAVDRYASGRPKSSSLARAAGNVVGTLPLFLAAGDTGIPETIFGAALKGAGEGAVMGGLQPVVTSGNYWTNKLEQTASGAAGGAAGGAAFHGISRVISPKVSSSIKKLIAYGVKPTTGQIAGGWTHSLENAIHSIPFIGDAVSNARARTLASFNRAAVNKALEPIGGTLSPGKLGRDAINCKRRSENPSLEAAG